MRKFFLRILSLLFIFSVMSIHPLLFILGGLFYLFFFKTPLEVILLGFYFEFIHGIPAGVIALPFGAALTCHTLIRKWMDGQNYVSGIVRNVSVFFIFIFSQGIMMAFEGMIGLYGFKVFWFL